MPGQNENDTAAKTFKLEKNKLVNARGGVEKYGEKLDWAMADGTRVTLIWARFFGPFDAKTLAIARKRAMLKTLAALRH